MAYDKRFGVDIPSEKQQQKEWTKRQFVLGLQEKIRHYYDEGKDLLAYKHAELLAKVQKFAEQMPEQRTTNVMFVTRFENEEEWNKHAKQHAKRITAIDAEADVATDTEKRSGVSDSESS